MHDYLFDMEAKDCIYLTVNSRLARHLLACFDQQRINQPVCETPKILPLQNWLIQQFHSVNTDGKTLLSDFQECCLWEMIIESSTHKDDLLQANQTAKIIKQAWQFLTEWQVPETALSPYDTQPEVQRLQEWSQSFEGYCSQKNWLPKAKITDVLVQNYSKLNLPKKIYLIGFDDINPSLQLLIKQIEEKHIVECLNISETTSTAKKITLANMDDEIQSMAQWAKDHFKNNSLEKIVCVVPELEKHRKKIHRVFTHQFCPENILPSANHQLAPFNISAGQAIDQHDMIKTALLALRWPYKSLHIETCSYLLQSPYLALNDTEQNMGAQIDAKLREKNLLFVTPSDLFEILTTLHASYPETSWLARLRNLIEIAGNNNGSQKPSDWVTHFISLLKILKWPGQHTQVSEAFQYLERFKKLLHEYAQLDLLYDKIDVSTALKRLSTLCKQTIFQPKSHQEPIQIMGVLEASGLTFDAAWIMGLHNGIWPPPTKPNPFIPFAIQQEYQMPHATAERELTFCGSVTKRLMKCAKNVIFSIPAQIGDQPLQPTRLLDGIAQISKADLEFDTHLEQAHTQSDLVEFTDNIAPAISNPQEVRGGSQIFKLQATCPFKAFATLRLNATPLSTPHIGIDSATSGTLIHQALFLLWGEIKDQQTLHKLSPDELSKLIDQSINNAAQDFTKEIIKQNSAYFWEIEKERLQTIIYQWMQYERDRPHFKVVQRESEARITVNKLPINLRIDRVDQLADGSHLLIDYKTGTNSINYWFQERLSEPQLPLYAAFTQTNNGEQYTGMAFAEIRTGNLAFKGVVSETHEYNTKPTPGFTPISRTKNNLMIHQWEGLREHWQVTLNQLATDFQDGIANVDPINTQACQFCTLQSLCRV